VQGVWFRAETQKQATNLGVVGWVRNLTDGRVEVVACGQPEALTALHEWLQHGPARAEVKEVIRNEIEPRAFSGFEIR
jgi:acylphosphatase